MVKTWAWEHRWTFAVPVAGACCVEEDACDKPTHATAAAQAGALRGGPRQTPAPAASPPAARALQASRQATRPAALAGAAAPSPGTPRQSLESRSTIALPQRLPPLLLPLPLLPLRLQPRAAAGAASPPRPACPATAAAIAAQGAPARYSSDFRGGRVWQDACCTRRTPGAQGPLACARVSIAAFSSAASARRLSTRCCRSRCAARCSDKKRRG